MLLLQDEEAAPAEAVQALRAWVSFSLEVLMCLFLERDRRNGTTTTISTAILPDHSPAGHLEQHCRPNTRTR